MEWEYGVDYAGFFAPDYQAIWDLNNSAINDWLSANTTAVNNGEFYVLNPGVESTALIELLWEYEISDEALTSFRYLRSTWLPGGFNQ